MVFSVLQCVMTFPLWLSVGLGAHARDSDSLALLLQARMLQQQGELDRALDLCDTALESLASVADVHALKIDVLLDQTRFPDASSLENQHLLEVAATAQTLFPSDHRFPLTCGMVLARMPRLVNQLGLEDPEVYLQQALDLMDAEDPYQQRDFAEALYYLGQRFLTTDRYFDAGEVLAQVCDADPELTWAWYYAGQSFELSGQIRRAKRFYDEFISRSGPLPQTTELALTLSESLIDTLLEPTPDHAADLAQLVNDVALHRGYFLDMASSLIQAGRYSVALTLLLRASGVQRAAPAWIARRHLCQMALHQYQQAVHDLSTEFENLDREMGRDRVMEYLLEAALLASNEALSKAAVQRFGLMGERSSRAAYLSACLQVRLYENAHEFEDIVARFPSEPLIREHMGIAQQMGHAGAVAWFRARLLLSYGDFDAALDSYGEAMPMAEPELRLEVADTMALSGRMQAAFDVYAELMNSIPDHRDVYNNFGYFLLEAGERLDLAATLIDRSLELDEQCVACMDSKGWLAYLRGDLDQAAAWLEKALSLDQGDVTMLEHLGDIYCAMGLDTQARRQYSLALEAAARQTVFHRYDEILNKLDPP